MLLACERGCLCLQRVKQDGGMQVIVIVVREGQRHVGNSEAEKFSDVTHPLDDGYVAVGDERRVRALVDVSVSVAPLCPEIIVLDYHESVASGQFVFSVEDGVAYSHVIYVGSLVGACDNDGVVYACPTVA